MFRPDQQAIKSISELQPLMKQLIEVLNSIHARQELMNEQLGKILFIAEKETGIEPKYEEITNDKGEVI